jgi:ectoine hydroxylase-related dioxygenase (phytanoyl-CoA dioxygenase family)
MNNYAPIVRSVTPDEVATYRKNGWVYLAGLLRADVADTMRSYLEERLGTTGDLGDRTENPKAILDDRPDRRDLRFLARDEHAEPFNSVCFSARMGENAHDLIGRDVDIRYEVDAVLLKVPIGRDLASSKTDWHQDFPNKAQDRIGFCVFWFALNEIPPERGGMRFLSGSHRAGPLGRTLRREADLRSQYRADLGEYPISPPLHMKPGDATCHGSLVVHAANANTTEDPRWAYSVGYFPDDVRYNGMPGGTTDGLGLVVGGRFEHPNFPVVYTALENK